MDYKKNSNYRDFELSRGNKKNSIKSFYYICDLLLIEFFNKRSDMDCFSNVYKKFLEKNHSS